MIKTPDEKIAEILKRWQELHPDPLPLSPVIDTRAKDERINSHLKELIEAHGVRLSEIDSLDRSALELRLAKIHNAENDEFFALQYSEVSTSELRRKYRIVLEENLERDVKHTEGGYE